MTWMLMDEAGNAIAAYADEVAAHAALRALVEDEPEARDSVLLLAYDDAGIPVGEATTFDDLPAATVNMVEAPAGELTVLLFRTTVGLTGGAGRDTDLIARPVHVATQSIQVPAP